MQKTVTIDINPTFLGNAAKSLRLAIFYKRLNSKYFIVADSF